MRDTVVEHLQKLGFIVREELDTISIANSLGYRADGIVATVGPNPRKLELVPFLRGHIMKGGHGFPHAAGMGDVDRRHQRDIAPWAGRLT